MRRALNCECAMRCGAMGVGRETLAGHRDEVNGRWKWKERRDGAEDQRGDGRACTARMRPLESESTQKERSDRGRVLASPKNSWTANGLPQQRDMRMSNADIFLHRLRRLFNTLSCLLHVQIFPQHDHRTNQPALSALHHTNPQKRLIHFVQQNNYILLHFNI